MSTDLKSVCVVSAGFENGLCCQRTGAEEEEGGWVGGDHRVFSMCCPPAGETAAPRHSEKSIIVIFFLFFVGCEHFSVQLEKQSSARRSCRRSNREELNFKRNLMIGSSSANPARDGFFLF